MEPRYSEKYSRLNYHLKKTEPFKNRAKRTVADQIKAYQRTEKVSVIPRKTLINNFQYVEEPIRQEHATANISNAASRVNIYQNSGRKNIFDRTGSEAKNKKIDLANRGKSLKYWKVGTDQTEPKIVGQIKEFFNGLFSNKDGCKCGPECPWVEEFMKWVEVPSQIYNRHYRKMLNTVTKSLSKPTKNAKDTQFSVESDDDAEEAKKQREKTFAQIQKDTTRTQSNYEVFRNPEVQAKCQRILMCYSLEDPEVGYVQGMNMVMAGILYHVRDEAQTYAVVRKLFHQIRKIYLKDFEQCYRHVDAIIQLIQSYILDLHRHLDSLGVELRVVIFPWVLSLLSVLVPLEHIHLVYLGYMKDGWHFIHKMILGVFLYFKTTLKAMEEPDEVLVFLSATNQEKKKSEWVDIINYSKQLKIQKLK